MSSDVGVIEGKEVGGDGPIEYILSTRICSASLVPDRVIAVEMPHKGEISGERE